MLNCASIFEKKLLTMLSTYVFFRVSILFLGVLFRVSILFFHSVQPNPNSLNLPNFAVRKSKITIKIAVRTLIFSKTLACFKKKLYLCNVFIINYNYDRGCRMKRSQLAEKHLITSHLQYHIVTTTYRSNPL